MKITSWALLSLCLMILSSHPVAAQDNRYYFGAAMYNPNYETSSANHRSTGVVGRLGYILSKNFAVETHFGGSIGSESNANPAAGQAQITDFYSAFLRANAQFGFSRAYVLGGITYGERENTPPNSTVTIKNSDSNTSFGFGVEVSDNAAFKIALEWIRYFDNQNYTVDAWNLGIVTYF